MLSNFGFFREYFILFILNNCFKILEQFQCCKFLFQFQYFLQKSYTFLLFLGIFPALSLKLNRTCYFKFLQCWKRMSWNTQKSESLRVLYNRELCSDLFGAPYKVQRLLRGDWVKMFAANLLNKLSSKYWDNVQKLRKNGENDLDFDDNYHFTPE